MKSRKLILVVLIAAAGLLTAAMMFWQIFGAIWTPWDYSVLENFYRVAAGSQERPCNGQCARAWSRKEFFGALTLTSTLLALAALRKNSWPLHLTGLIIASALVAFACREFARSSLFPLVSLGGSFLFMFSGMLLCLHRARAKEHAFIRSLFSKSVSEHTLKQLLAQPERLKLEGEEKELTVLFAALSGNTPLVESIPASALVKLLKEFFTEMADIIIAEGGRVDKFLGDTLMAEFGAPLPSPNHAELAVRAALKMQRRLLDLQKQWERVGVPPLHCQIGIHTGLAVIGNLGSREVCDYTVLGEAVNLAARLRAANQNYGTTLLISEATSARLSPNEFRTRWLDTLELKNQAMKIYEVHGDLATYRSPIDAAYYQNYERAFSAYVARDFERARTSLEAALHLLPHDPAALSLLARLTRSSETNTA